MHHVIGTKAETDGDEASTADNAGPFRFETLTIIAGLDQAHPLTEAKWVRTGHVEEWMMSLAAPAQQNGKSESAVAQPRPTSIWKDKLRVADPDPAPTFQHALESWLASASTRGGFDKIRNEFASTQFGDVKNILEVLLRMIRSGSGSAVSIAALATSSTLPASTLAAQAVLLDAPYPEQQTTVSLASFQLFKMGIEAALASGMDEKDIRTRVGSVVRSLPYSMIFKSLDWMFADYRRRR